MKKGTQKPCEPARWSDVSRQEEQDREGERSTCKRSEPEKVEAKEKCSSVSSSLRETSLSSPQSFSFPNLLLFHFPFQVSILVLSCFWCFLQFACGFWVGFSIAFHRRCLSWCSRFIHSLCIRSYGFLFRPSRVSRSQAEKKEQVHNKQCPESKDDWDHL